MIRWFFVIYLFISSYLKKTIIDSHLSLKRGTIDTFLLDMYMYNMKCLTVVSQVLPFSIDVMGFSKILRWLLVLDFFSFFIYIDSIKINRHLALTNSVNTNPIVNEFDNMYLNLTDNLIEFGIKNKQSSLDMTIKLRRGIQIKLWA